MEKFLPVMFIALFTATSFGESHRISEVGSKRPGVSLKECKTCAYFEGYIALWHQGARLPAKYSKEHTDKQAQALRESDYPSDMWAQMKCGDSDRSAKCGKHKIQDKCKSATQCYWQAKPNVCQLNSKMRGRMGGQTKQCDGSCPREPKSYIQIDEARSKCEQIKDISECKKDQSCEEVKVVNQCLPKIELLTCSRVNAKAGINKEECCDAMDGCDWNKKSGQCGPWSSTVKSCNLWIGKNPNGTRVKYQYYEFPKKTLLKPKQYWASWGSLPSTKVPRFSSAMKNQCRTAKHLFDGHGRSQWSAINDVSDILKNQDQIREINVQHWGCSTFKRSSYDSKFARRTRKHMAKVGRSVFSLFGAIPRAIQKRSFAPFTPIYSQIGGNYVAYSLHMIDDPARVFMRRIEPEWKRHRDQGKEVKITLMANQVTSNACSTAEESRMTNTPFALGVHDGKFVQWPARCSRKVRCYKKSHTGKSYICRLPESEDWAERIKPPSFDPKSLENESVVLWRCDYDDKKKKGSWTKSKDIPNFRFVIREIR